MNNPLVSIIIPSYNRAHLIGETLDSVLAQTYQNWECIVVDDGSTDASFEVVERYSEKDSRIILFKRDREPKGAPTCRNIGIERSGGSYLIFLDSDDLLANYCLENRVLAFNNHLDCDLLVYRTLLFDKKMGDSAILWNVIEPTNYLYRFLRLDPPWALHSVIWKASAFKEKLAMDESVLSFQDWELHIRAIINGFKFNYFATCDSYCRNAAFHLTIGRESISISHLNSHRKLFLKIEKQVLEFDKSKEIQIALSSLFFWLANQFLLIGKRKEAFKVALSSFNVYLPIYSILLLFYVVMFNRRGFYSFHKLFKRKMPAIYFNHFKYNFRKSKLVLDKA